MAERITGVEPLLKTVDEDLVYTFDFTPNLGDETFAGSLSVVSSVSGLTIGTPEVNTSIVTQNNITVAVGKGIQVRISGGADDTDYTLTVRGTDTAGNVRETVWTLKVRDN